MFFAILLIILGALTRLVPHAPNFSPLVGIALFSGVYLRQKHGYLIPFTIYVLSDLLLGLHGTILFTWSSILIIYVIGRRIMRHKTVARIGMGALSASFLFFILTNFGVWLIGWYPPTIEGLLQCYVYALPFFRTSLIADCVYVTVLFGVFELFLKSQKLAATQKLSA